MDQLASRGSKQRIATEVIKTTVSVVVLGLGIGLLIYLYSLRQPPADKESDALIPLVSTFDAQPFDGSIDLLISGTVVPAYEIKVSSEVNGRILTKYPECEAGNYVTKGTKLLEIDPEDLQLTLKSNEADLKQSKKMVAETQADIDGTKRNIELAKDELELLREDYERNLSLQEQGAASKAEVDQSERSVLTAETQLTTRKNTLISAEARLERMKAAIEVSESRINQTKLALTKTTVTAPANGVIVQEMIQEGEMASQGTHLLTFENTEKIEVLCTLTARDLDWIRENKRVDMTGLTPEERMSAIYRIPRTKVLIFDSKNPEVIWNGTLERVDGIGRDDKTKTIPVRIVIDKPIIETAAGPKALVRNMFVKCRIEVEVEEPDPKRQPLSFPATGLRPGNFVWVATPANTLARKKVSVLDQVRDPDTDELMAVIRSEESGVQPGDAIITSPLSQATVGAEVRLMDERDQTDTDDQQGEE